MRKCSVCNHQFEKFVPLDDTYRRKLIEFGAAFSLADFETLNVEEYQCPKCGASDRERLYALFIRKRFPKRGLTDSGQVFRILDFAPAKPLADFLREWFQSGVQPSEYRSADLLMEGVDDRVDVMDLGVYPDCSWDLILCSHLLEHVPDDRRAMRELFRILRPGGSAILMVPICLSATRVDEDPSITGEGERWRRFGQGDHVRLYSREGFLKRLREAGFGVEEWKESSFPKRKFEQYGLSRSSVLYVGKRPRGPVTRLFRSIRKRF